MERAKTNHPNKKAVGEGGQQPYLDGAAAAAGVIRLDQSNDHAGVVVVHTDAVAPTGSDVAFGMHFHDLGLVEGDTFGV